MKKNRMIQGLLWVLEGILVGFGAIMPGISGGTLCVAFGMYKPLIDVLSEPRANLKRHWKMLGLFVLGGAVGFVGLSGLAGWLMGQNSAAVTCAFIGLILGTVPELWKDAGEKGRGGGAYIALAVGFAAMLAVLTLLRNQNAMTMTPGILSYLFCGVLWGVSFIVPGLSSSTLLLFFGLYQPMLDGIARLNPGVILPIAVGAVLCVLLLTKGVNAAFNRFHSVMSHAILGVVVATTLMIFPDFGVDAQSMLLYVGCIVGGAVLSFLLGRACGRLKEQTK